MFDKEIGKAMAAYMLKISFDEACEKDESGMLKKMRDLLVKHGMNAFEVPRFAIEFGKYLEELRAKEEEDEDEDDDVDWLEMFRRELGL